MRYVLCIWIWTEHVAIKEKYVNCIHSNRWHTRICLYPTQTQFCHFHWMDACKRIKRTLHLKRCAANRVLFSLYYMKLNTPKWHACTVIHIVYILRLLISQRYCLLRTVDSMNRNTHSIKCFSLQLFYRSDVHTYARKELYMYLLGFMCASVFFFFHILFRLSLSLTHSSLFRISLSLPRSIIHYITLTYLYILKTGLNVHLYSEIVSCFSFCAIHLSCTVDVVCIF